MLPASQNVTKLAFFLCGPCLQQRVPRENVVALLTEASVRMRPCDVLLRGAVRSPSRTVVCRPHERLLALEWSPSSFSHAHLFATVTCAVPVQEGVRPKYALGGGWKPGHPAIARLAKPRAPMSWRGPAALLRR